jgi:hypothetical protein
MFEYITPLSIGPGVALTATLGGFLAGAMTKGSTGNKKKDDQKVWQKQGTTYQ